MSATLGGWCCVPAWIRRRERSRARLAPLSLPYLSPNRGKSRRGPSDCVESFLTVRRLYFPREFVFGVRRRAVVVSGPGTVRISVGTPTFTDQEHAIGTGPVTGSTVQAPRGWQRTPRSRRARGASRPRKRFRWS